MKERRHFYCKNKICSEVAVSNDYIVTPTSVVNPRSGEAFAEIKITFAVGYQQNVDTASSTLVTQWISSQFNFCTNFWSKKNLVSEHLCIREIHFSEQQNKLLQQFSAIPH